MNKLFRAFFLSVNERQGSGKLDDVCTAKIDVKATLQGVACSYGGLS